MNSLLHRRGFSFIGIHSMMFTNMCNVRYIRQVNLKFLWDSAKLSKFKFNNIEIRHTNSFLNATRVACLGIQVQPKLNYRFILSDQTVNLNCTAQCHWTTTKLLKFLNIFWMVQKSKSWKIMTFTCSSLENDLKCKIS